MPLEQLLAQWGLPAVFLGTVAEGEGAAFLGGVMAHRGLFSFEAAALAAAAGAFLIDQIMFQVGRHATGFAFAQRLLARPAAASVLQHVRARPILACLSIRFIYGLKTVGTLAIGASGIRPLSFVLLNLISTLVWSHIVTGLGFGVGTAIERLWGRVALHSHLSAALVLAVALIAVAEVLRRRR
ncbi:MAG: VTT domain-containing protein [Rhodobacteraceae bacterium]|nr:VTT domain-containing protein [Paracoccaceae bacterium]